MTARWLTIAAILFVAGCDDMADQPKLEPWEATDLFPDGKVVQAPPEGAVARGDLDRDAARTTRPPLDRALLERGRERYNINCSPCHGRDGGGDGMIVRRGMPAPPSYHQDRLRQVPDQHFVDVIEEGYGVMYPYDSRVAPRDRWAIVAYIRALQLSQNVQADTLSPEARRRLEEAEP